MFHALRTAIASATLSLALTGSLSAASIWWEAEKPSATNFPPAQKGDAKEQDVLSEGLWIGVGNDRQDTKFLEYDVDVPAAGDYDFFARKFWKHGPFRWRFDDQSWQTLGKDCTLLDNAEIRTHWGANWVPAGSVKLSAGKHRLRIELLEKTGVAYFDAFLLTTEPFTPRGKIKPGTPFPPAPEGWANFAPAADNFAPSPIDLRPLNEKFAGEHGFITVRGEQFIQSATNQPIRFWAVNAGPAVVDMPRKYVDTLARFLARKGVNMVRMHGPLYIQSGPQAGQIDEKHLDNVFYFIAAMKSQGIYCHLSIHFQHWLRLNELPQFAEYTADTMPFAIHFFNRDFQKIYESWWDALLTRTNPYTGTKMVDDPAMSSLELLNEDGLFFWTFDYKRIPAKQMQILEKQFAAWLTAKYGSPEKALQAWGGKARSEDALADGRVGFVTVWEMANTRDLRAQDTVRFLAETQRKFFDNHRDYVRKLGFKGAICASNWITGSPQYLEPVDSWTNAGVDFFDHHGYFDEPNKKNVQAFGFQPGDQYASRSAIRMDPGEIGKPPVVDFPFLDVIQDGKPSMVSEYAWNNPNQYRSEAPLFVSSLASLTGMDAMVLFALDSVPQWRPTETENYWPIQTPADIGQFPAAALIFRKALVREAEPVARINVNTEDMFHLKGAPARNNRLQDSFRAADAPQGQPQPIVQNAIDNRDFAVGKVEMSYTDKPSSFEQQPLEKFVDPQAKVIASMNGDTRWEYGKGIFSVTAEQAQGSAGFLGAAGTIQLPDVTVSSPMEFGSIVLVSLDGQPIRTSSKMLLQVMSQQRNAGWSAEGDPGKLQTIKSLGTMPIQFRQFAGTVTLSRPDAAGLKITALDFNGYPTGAAVTGGEIRLQPTAPYYVIEK